MSPPRCAGNTGLDIFSDVYFKLTGSSLSAEIDHCPGSAPDSAQL